MGMINRLQQASDRNVRMQQHRVYDLPTLREDLLAAGLRPVRDGGIFLKPFTHAQMERVVKAVDAEILPGLAVLGREFPELASEIFVEAIADGA